MTKRWPIALLILLALLIYWPLTVGRRVLYWGLPLYQFHPWHKLVTEAILTGNLPLWTDQLGNGTPLLANHQTALFYPFNLIYFVMPVEHAMGYSVVLHLILAGLFAYAWGRTIGLSRFAATVTGLSFMLSGFLVARTQFITIVNGAAWLPLLFALAERLVRRRIIVDAVWLGTALALQFLAGHAQVWFYSLLAVGCYALARTWAMRREQHSDGDAEHRPGTGALTTDAGNTGKNQWWSVVGRQRSVVALLTCALVIALGLPAIQLLPTAELALHSQRVDGLDPGEAMTYSFWPWRLLTLAIPDLFGNPATGDYWGYATYWEDAGYLGVLPFLLALTAVWGWGWRRLSVLARFSSPLAGLRSKAARSIGLHARLPGITHEGFLIVFFILLSLSSLILAMGRNTPVYPLLFKYVPGFGAFRAPARFLLLYTFGVSTLAGMGADRFRLTYRTQYGLRLTAAGAGAMLVVSLAVGQVGLTIKPTFAPAIARFALLLGLSAIFLLLRGREPDEGDPRVANSPLPAWTWRGLIVAFIAADLALFAGPLTPTIDPALYQTMTGADHFFLAQTDKGRLFAAYDYDYNTKYNTYLDFATWGPSDLAHWLAFRERLVPNLNVLTHTASANNDDPLVVGRWRKLTDALRVARWPARLRLLRMMNVSYLLAESPYPGLSPVADVPYLYRLSETMPRAWVVSQARVIPAPANLLAELMDPTFDPATEVLLEEIEHPYSLLPTPYSLLPSNITSLHEGWNSRTIDLIVSQPSYLVLAYTYFPGWRATVDAKPTEILRANYAFMALPLEKGKHQVVLDYRPISFLLGAFCSALSVLAVVATAVVHTLPKLASWDKLAIMKTAIIIPTYNERENLADLVAQILNLDIGAHVIVVDDNSPDGTGKLAEELAARDGHVRVVHRPGKLGLGTAYIAGFKQALAEGADRVVTMDADFSHNPRYIPALVALTERYHVGIGSRYVPGGGVTATWGVHRKFLSWGANHFAQLMLGLKARDCTAGFRCYRREVLQSIDLDRIFSNGYSFLIEMMYKCQRLGYAFGEIPILFENRYRGNSKISRGEIYKAMYTVLRLSISRLLFWRAVERYGTRAQSSAEGPEGSRIL